MTVGNALLRPMVQLAKYHIRTRSTVTFVQGCGQAKRAQKLSEQLMKMSEQYFSNVVIMFYGDDFRFTTPFEWKIQYEALRFLFDEINSKNEIEIGFGTITKFFDVLEEWYTGRGTRPTTLKGDFFPYELHASGSWSGYYSTRPFYKAQERRLHWLLRAADLLSAQVSKDKRSPNTTAMLNTARKALLLFQHHDAITGTSKKHVMKDYSEQLHNATLLANSVIESSLGAVSNDKEEMVEYSMSSQATTSLKVLDVTKKNVTTLKVVNTLPYPMEDVVSVRINNAMVEVEFDGQSIEAQIEPYIRDGENR
ncbi:alpha mannosidase, middle domain protein [Ostertagia ostertagi]